MPITSGPRPVCILHFPPTLWFRAASICQLRFPDSPSKEWHGVGSGRKKPGYFFFVSVPSLVEVVSPLWLYRLPEGSLGSSNRACSLCASSLGVGTASCCCLSRG